MQSKESNIDPGKKRNANNVQKIKRNRYFPNKLIAKKLK